MNVVVLWCVLFRVLVSRSAAQALFLTIALHCVHKSRSKSDNEIEVHEEGIHVKAGSSNVLKSEQSSSDSIIQVLVQHNTAVFQQQHDEHQQQLVLQQQDEDSIKRDSAS